MMKRILAYILAYLFLISTTVFGANTYYVKNGGSDALSGADDTNAWETLAKVSATVANGDTVYLKKDSVWAEQLDITGINGLTIDAYGAGTNKPKITGAETVTGSWSVYSGNIYQISLSDTVYQVFDDDEWVMLAHEPDGPTVSNHFTDDVGKSTRWQIGETNDETGITFTDAMLTGASVGIIPKQWFRNGGLITGYSANTIYLYDDGRLDSNDTWNDHDGRVPEPNWYWIADKLVFLDTANEWYYNSSTHVLYAYQTGGGSPAGTWKYTKRQYGIHANQVDNLTVQNIAIDKAIVGINLENCLNFYIDAVDFTDIGTQKYVAYDVYPLVHIGNGLGVLIYGTGGRANETGTVTQSTFTDLWQGAVGGKDYQGYDIDHRVNITYNTSNGTAMIGEEEGWGFNSGTSYVVKSFYNWTGRYWNISNNNFTDIGGMGISFGKYSIIDNNVITHAMMYFGDGGAIYGGFDGASQFTNNTIDMTGCQNGGGNTKTGIYLDGALSNCLIDGNVITGSQYCLFNHGGSDNTFTNNICLDHRTAGFLASTWSTNSISGLVVQNNIFDSDYCATDESCYHAQIAAWGTGRTDVPEDDWFDNKSDYDYNQYYPDGSTEFTTYDNFAYTQKYNFSGWKSATGLDVHSTIIEYSMFPMFQSAKINSNGNTISITFSSDIQCGATGCTSGLSITGFAGGNPTVSGCTGSGQVVDCSLSRIVLSTEEATGYVSYSQPGDGVEEYSTGDDVITFSNGTLVNDSIQVPETSVLNLINRTGTGIMELTGTGSMELTQ